MNKTGTSNTTWWGEHSIDVGQVARWEIGPLLLQVRRLEKEWQIASTRNEDNYSKSKWKLTLSNDALTGENPLNRYLFKRTTGKLVVKPALPDRAIIMRPASPLYIPAGQEASIYVSSPLWLRLQAGEPVATLEDIPIQRPSDTWFGHSKTEGQLCYAGKTHARVSLDLLPMQPFRAVTPIVIRNKHQDVMVLDRLSLPVELLSLFSTVDGLLWTQPVTMVKEIDGYIAALEFGQLPNNEIKNTTLISDPRRKPDHHIITKTLTDLFG